MLKTVIKATQVPTLHVRGSQLLPVSINKNLD